MALHPAQERALAYLRRRGSESDFGETLGRLRQVIEEIGTILLTLGEDVARRRPGPGRWSVQEVVDHLTISHRPALEQWRRALADQDPGPAIDAHLLSPGAGERDFRSVRREFIEVHREWLGAASSWDGARRLDGENPPRKIPIVMVIKGEVRVEGRVEEEVFEWIEDLDAKAFALGVAVHLREHKAQLLRIFEALKDDTTFEGPVLNSRRLRLEPVTMADSQILEALFNHPEIGRYLFDDEKVPPSQVEEIILSSQRRFRSHGYGLWLARASAGIGGEEGVHGEPVGFAGYGFFFDPPELQIYYGLDPRFWGRGLATEMARHLLHFGCEELGFESILGATDPPNEASARVMERAGMERIADQIRGGRRTLYFRFECCP